MKRLLCLLTAALIALSSCAAPSAPQTVETDERQTAPAVNTAYETIGDVEEQTEPPLPDNVKEEDGVLVWYADDYSIKYPKGFTASENNGKLTVCPNGGKGRYVTLEQTAAEFSERLSASQTAEAIAASLHGSVTDGPSVIELGGAYCVRFGLTSDGVYITCCLCSFDGKTYIICAGTEDKEDDLPARIAQTVKFNIKENAQ